MRRFLELTFLVFTFTLTFTFASYGWGMGHDTVARETLRVLPGVWGEKLRAGEGGKLIIKACHAPDDQSTKLTDRIEYWDEELCTRLDEHNGKPTVMYRLHAADARCELIRAMARAIKRNDDKALGFMLGCFNHSVADTAGGNHSPLLALVVGNWRSLGLKDKFDSECDCLEKSEEGKAIMRRATESVVGEAVASPTRVWAACFFDEVNGMAYNRHEVDILRGGKSAFEAYAEEVAYPVRRTIEALLTAEAFAALPEIPDFDAKAEAKRAEEVQRNYLMTRSIHDDALTKGLVPASGTVPEIGVLYDPTGFWTRGLVYMANRSFAAQICTTLKKAHNAGLLDLREVMTNGVPAGVKTLVVPGSGYRDNHGLSVAPITKAILAFEEKGGKLIWIGGNPEPPVQIFPEAKNFTKNPRANPWGHMRGPVAAVDMPGGKLLLPSSKSFTCVKAPKGGAGWYWDQLGYNFMIPSSLPDGAREVLAFETKVGVRSTVGYAVGNRTFLPSFTLFPYIFTDEIPQTNPLKLELDACGAAIIGEAVASPSFRRISVAEYRDRMRAGWLGQCVGVSWGAPTEFKYKHKIIPEDKVPAWTPQMVNGTFNQDDLYVEMTFVKTLAEKGLDVSMREIGIDFANSRYHLWHANGEGHRNLRLGIAPPDSGHPRFNGCANDIDYQIEADFSGLIAPGCPQRAVRFGETFGRVMNYGDGVYAGQFIGAMYAEAFFERDAEKIVRAALAAIPAECRYARMVRDLLAAYEKNPDDWRLAWEMITGKYGHARECKVQPEVLDATLNGAYVLLGVLWGRGDPEQSIVIAMRAGMDSDCNPANAGGVVFTACGLKDVPAKFYGALNKTRTFDHTSYTIDALVDVCEKLARQVVVAEGGRIEETGDAEYFVIPMRPVRPSAMMDFNNPGPVANAHYSEADMRRIDYYPYSDKTGRFGSMVTGVVWGVDSAVKPQIVLGPNGRAKISLNEGWKSDLEPEEGATQHLEGVKLPHSWLDYQGMRRLAHGNVHGRAIYRRTFHWNPPASQLRAHLVFEGVGQYLTLRVNGKEICARKPAGRLVTTLDVTDALVVGDNEIEAVCDHPSDDLDMPWICGGCGPQSCEGPEPLGLFRNVSLEVTDEVRIAPFGVQIVYDRELTKVEVRVEVENKTAHEMTRTVRVEEKELGFKAEKAVVLGAKEVKLVTLSNLASPTRWSPKNPKLYAFTSSLLASDCCICDAVTTKTGFRTIQWPKSKPSSGRVFKVNGEPFFIHGTCETDHRLGGSMAFDRREIDARCDEVEKLGFNAFRDGHEPHDLHYSERWDADGVLWWPQISTHHAQESEAWKSNFIWAVTQWVKERRNSPSVILWGLQNESTIDEEFSAEMTNLIHALDPLSGPEGGRLVTTCNGGAGVDWDVIQNWSGTYAGRFGKLEDYSDALRLDDQLLNGEYGAWRLVGFHGPEDEPFVFGMPHTEENAARILMEKIKRAWKVKDEVCGQFLWTLFTHENPGRTRCEGGYRLIDKIGPVNNKGPLALNGQRTAAWYMYRAFGHHFKNGTVDQIIDQPLSAWLAEGRRLEEGAALPAVDLAPAKGRTYFFRMNCGGDAVTDSLGNVWQGDAAGVYSHSWSEADDLKISGYDLNPVLGSQGELEVPLKNVTGAEAELFRTYRYGRNRLFFTIPAKPRQTCYVEAYFVEPGSYGRIFDVQVNDRYLAKDFNLGAIPAGNVVKKVLRVHADKNGVLRFFFPEVAVNQAVISAIAVSTPDTDSVPLAPTRAGTDTKPSGYPYNLGKTWKSLTAEVAEKLPKELMPKGPAAKLYPIRAQLPPPPDRDGYKCGWFGPHYANDFNVIFKVKSGNPVGKTITWKLVHDTTHEEFRSGTYRVESLTEDGKVSMPLGFQVNAGWYNVMYRIDDCELVATEMK